MPVDYSKYPPNWKTEIRPRILRRANNKCERCGVENYAIIVRSNEDKSNYLVLHDDGCYYTPGGDIVRMSEIPEEYCGNDIRVVLTIAHIHSHNPMNCDDNNLQALCQRCHLLLDAPLHTQNAKVTRLNKRRQEILNTGQLPMFDSGGE